MRLENEMVNELMLLDKRVDWKKRKKREYMYFIFEDIINKKIYWDKHPIRKIYFNLNKFREGHYYNSPHLIGMTIREAIFFKIFYDKFNCVEINKLPLDMEKPAFKYLIQGLNEDSSIFNSKGCPDFLIRGTKRILFIEVKSLQDYLRRCQLEWIKKNKNEEVYVVRPTNKSEEFLKTHYEKFTKYNLDSS